VSSPRLGFGARRSNVNTEASRPEPGKKDPRHCHTVDRNSKREISKKIGNKAKFSNTKMRAGTAGWVG
jgi:hypothetical protein